MLVLKKPRRRRSRRSQPRRQRKTRPPPPQWFGIWDAETAPVAARQRDVSNTALLPNANIAFGGSGRGSHVHAHAGAGQFGSSTVTVTVTDAQGQIATTTFQYSVASTVAIPGDQNTANQNDVFKIVRNSTFLDIFRNDMVTPVVHVDYAAAAHTRSRGLAGTTRCCWICRAGIRFPQSGFRSMAAAGATSSVSSAAAAPDAITLQDGDIVIGAAAADVVAGAEELHLNLGAGTDTLTTVGGNASVFPPAW
jgi:hypothetical protein